MSTSDLQDKKRTSTTTSTRHHHHHHHRHRYSKEEKRRMSIRRLVSLLLAFVLGGALFCLVFFAEQRVGWQSNQLMYRTMIGDGYAYRNVELLKSRLAELVEKASLPEEIIENFYDEDVIYREYSQNIEKALLEGKDVASESESFGKSFETAVLRELTDEGIFITEALQERISTMKGQAVESHEELLSVSYMKKFYDLSQEFIDKAKVVAIIAGFVLIGALLVLLRMYSYKHHGLQYASAGIFFSTIVNGAAVLVLSRNGWISDVGIGPETYRELLAAFYKKAMQFGLMITLIQVALLTGTVILSQMLKKR